MLYLGNITYKKQKNPDKGELHKCSMSKVIFFLLFFLYVFCFEYLHEPNKDYSGKKIYIFLWNKKFRLHEKEKEKKRKECNKKRER